MYLDIKDIQYKDEIFSIILEKSCGQKVIYL
jgi:hypothetical protein